MSCQFFPFLFNYRISLRNPWEQTHEVLGFEPETFVPHGSPEKDERLALE